MEKKPIKILLVEDNPAEARSVQECLLEAEHTVYNFTHAERFSDAKKILDEHAFDVVLLDLTLPDSKGIETVEHTVKVAPHIPIVVLTGINDNGLATQALQAGAEDYLIKGKTDCTSLVRAIRYAIERKRLSTLLQISEERYRTFFENTKDIFYRSDMRGIIKFISSSVKKYGYSVSEVIGKDVRLFYDNPAYRDVLVQILMKEKLVHDFELVLKRKDGSPIHASLSAMLILKDDGKPLYIDGILRDITERKEAERVTKQTKDKYKTIVENTFDLIYSYSIDGTITYVSPNVKQYGYTEGDIIGHNIYEFIHPDDRERVKADFEKILETGADFITETRLLKKDGDFIDAEEMSKIIWVDGKPAQLTGVIRNITERKQAEEILRAKKEELDKFFTSNLDLLCIANTDGYFVRLNTEWEKVFGYSLNELKGKRFLDFIHPYDLASTLDAIKDLKNDNKIHNFVNRYKCKDGTYKWIEWRSTLAGKTIYSSARDITERKLIEKELRRSEEQYRHLFYNNPHPMWVYDRVTLGFVAVNEAAIKHYGYSEEEFLSMTLKDTRPPEDIPMLLQNVATIDTPYQKSNSWRHKKKDGTIIDVEITSHSIEWNGRPARIVVSEDVTQRKQAESALRKSEELNKSITQTAVDAIIAINSDGNVVLWNNAADKIFGYSVLEMYGKDLSIIIPKMYRGKHESAVKRLKDGSDGTLLGPTIELTALRKDGTKFPIELSLSEWKAQDQKFYTGIIRNITERKHAEVALRDSEKLLTESQRIARMGSWSFNMVDGNLRWSDTMYDIYGVNKEKFPLSIESFITLIHTEDRALTQQWIEQKMKGEKIGELDFRIVLSNGEIRHIRSNGEAVIDANGKFVQMTGTAQDITERKRNEEALQESELRWQFAIEGAGDGLWDWNVSTNEVFYSNQWKSMLGYEDHEIGNTLMEWDSRVHLNDKEWVHKEIEKHFRGETPVYISEHRVRCKDGTYKWILDRGRIVKRTDDGKPQRVIGTHTDITERKRTEEILRESETKFRTVASMSVATIFIYQGTKFVYVNPASEAITGYTIDELLKMNFWDIVHPDFRELIKERGMARLNGESIPSRYEFKIVTKKGEEKWLSFGAEIIQYQGKTASLGVAFDITSRKQSEHIQTAVYRIAKIAVSAKTLESLYKGVHEIIGEIMDARNFYIALHDEEKDTISFPYYVDETDFIPEPKKSGKGMTEYVLRTGKSCLSDLNHFLELQRRGEIELIGAPSLIWLGVPLKANDKTFGVMAIQHYSNPNAYGEREQQILEFISSEVARAIEQKKSEQQLELLATALESTANAIIITNRQGEITWVNTAFSKMTCYTIDEAVGKNPRVLKSGKHDAEFYTKMWDTISSGKVWQGELINKKKDGTLYNEDMTITPVKSITGEIINFIAVKQDITERKNIETQSLRSQRMESIGVLAGGIAHDLNNVLAPILMAVELLSRDQGETQKKAMLDILRLSATRGASIVKQVLTFSRGAEGERSVLQPKHLVREIESFAKQTFPKDIEISAEISKNLWTLVGDATQIHQILLNLCVNARDAMQKGGKLTIAAENVYLDASYAKMHREAKTGPYVMFKVTDTGTGIPESIIDKIFDPFFTTKEVGKGTGLGLSTVIGIVKSHKGFITVTSEVGKGTEFKVYLPASDGVDVKEVAQSNDQLPRGNGELILVVDDEPSIREITGQTLESFGYNVLTANDGVEAIAKFAQNKNKVQLVLTDMSMPVLGGTSAIKAIEKINPSIRVIATSGLLAQKFGAENIGRALKGFLQKPYTTEQLLRMVYDVLQNS